MIPAFRLIPYPLEKGHLFYPYPGCTETADRELLPCEYSTHRSSVLARCTDYNFPSCFPAFHEVSVYPKKELPFFILFTAGLCSFTAMLAMLTHQFPELMGVFAKAVSTSTTGRRCPRTLSSPSDISNVFVLRAHLFTRPLADSL